MGHPVDSRSRILVTRMQHSNFSLDFLVAVVGDSGLADLLLCAALMASFRKELDSIIRCSEEMLDLLSSEEEEDEKVLLEKSLLLVTSFLPRSSSFSLLLSSLKVSRSEVVCDVQTLLALTLYETYYL